MVVYVITGANRNIGLGLITVLAHDPANVIIALNRSPIPSNVLKPNIHEVRVDLLDLEALRTAVETVRQLSGGKVDVLLCNAGAHQLDDTPLALGREEELAEKLQAAFRVNTVAPTQLISLLLPLLREGSSKKIAIITSGHGVSQSVRDMKMKGRLPYGASKAAMDNTMIRISNELSSEGFTVFSIGPSVISDRASAEAKGIDFDKFKAQIAAIPGSSGVFDPVDGAEILLDTIARMTTKDNGRVVGMWGTEDRWI